MTASSPFDRLFADLVPPESEGQAPGQPGLPPGAEDRLREALRLFGEGLYAGSAEALGNAEPLTGLDPRAAALVAAHRGLATGRLQPAIQQCLALLEARQHLPDLHLVLGVLLLKANRRAQAHAAFRTGLGLAPGHSGLRARLAAMGQRRPPTLGFLPRAHPVNRWLGVLLAWLERRPAERLGV